MGLTTNTSEFVKTHLNEAIKTYMAYDGSSRLEYIYVAGIDTANGEACMGTQYTYSGTSSRVVKSKEFKSTWNSSWDI